MPATNDLIRLRTHEVLRFLNAHRVFFYTLVSLLSVSVVITNALKNYSNFYSVAIYLSKSSRSVLVLANFGVLLTLLCGHIVQRVFFGSLRPNEVERLYDRLWFFITESLLAFTIFRDEFDTPFALMFGFLLFVKSFHWLASDRVEWMDQRPYPGPPLLFHFRMTVLFAILSTTDFLMFLFAVEHTLSVGVGGMVLFASEYGILMASIMNTIFKYLLSAYDLRRAGRRGGENAPPWDNKSMWIFYIELATDFLKLTTYLVFFIIIIAFYGLPLNIIRDVYITARSFVTRLRALHRYQTATRNMDERYPNATEEELAAMSDRTCIICREEMVPPGTQEPVAHPDGPNTTPKKLPCGHIFHFYCLRSWLERQQSCPTCRRTVLDDVTPGPQVVAGGLAGQPQNRAPVPQQANPWVPMDPQNPQGGNNPLGFIGRFFGFPARFINPAPNRQVVQNFNNNQGQAGAQQPGIFINYQVQYQFPRNQNDGNLQPAQQAQQRMPIPPYPGFPGPGGLWQQWPAAEDGVNGAQVGTRGGPNERSLSSPTSDLSPGLNENAASQTGSTSPILSEASSQESEGQGSLRSRREAAAQAALDRLIRLNISLDNRPKEPTSALPNVDPEPPNSSQTKPSDNVPTSNTCPPQLIPLLDHRSHGSLSRTPIPRDAGAQHVNGESSALPHTQNGGPANGVPMQNRFAARFPHSQQGYSSTSSQLPPALTDEQLATLDILTRDSIDEHLRILEGVSTAVYRCIDDLMRLRSALPPLNTPSAGARSAPHPTEPSLQSTTSGREDRDTSTRHGKERMRDMVDVETLDTQGDQEDQSPSSNTEA